MNKLFISSFLLLFIGSFLTTAVEAATTSTSCFTTKVGDPSGDKPDLPAECKSGTNGGGAKGPCQAAPPANFTSEEEYRNAISDKWGINLFLPLHQMQNAWKEFHEIDCTGILQDISGSVVGSWENGWSEQFSCPGDDGVNLYISSQFSGEWVETHLVHELTHIWQNCSSRGETNRLENNTAYDTEGGITNYSRTKCGFDVDVYKEDHAESISLYLNPQSGESTCAITNVNPFTNGGFPEHARVARNGTGK